MDTERNAHLTLEHIPADRRLVDELSSHGLITQAARDDALQLLYPHKNWGLWVSRLLLVIGTSLILAGIVYFFAFNWAKIPPAVKLGLVEASIFLCVAAACAYGLERLSGKLLALSASVLVGVFLAVFGQIYQTGADAYTLFMMWPLLIAGWVVLTEFAALWALWLVVSNIFLVLYWDQAVLPDHDTTIMITSILAAFNLTFLGLREFFMRRGATWLSERWTRLVLIIPILICLLIPTIIYIAEPERATAFIAFGALSGIVTHAVLFTLYKYKLPDMWALSAVFLSGCIMVEAAGIKMLTEIFKDAEAVFFLSAGIITIGIFTFAISSLRQIARNMEASHVR